MRRSIVAACLALVTPVAALHYERDANSTPADKNANGTALPRDMPAEPMSAVRVTRKMLSKATPSLGHPYICVVGTRPERRVITKIDDDEDNRPQGKVDGIWRGGKRSKKHEAAVEVHKPGQTIMVGKSGMNLTIIKVGDAKSYPRAGDILVTHYTGKLHNGTVFETSRTKNKPFEFTVGVHEVIKGIDEGIMLMSTGERGVLHVPAALAYGRTGTGDGHIPRNADLDYDVELLSIERN